MQFLFRYLRPHGRRQHHRSFVDAASIKYVKDRGLDHAVQREKHLKPMINIKNLIKSEPSKSLPLSVITQNKEFLKIPTRPIDFIRKYPSVFQEISPGGISVHPHIKLTPQVLDLDAEEQLVYESVSYRKNVSDRVLKLLMISRIDKIPLKILDFVKFELGLPPDLVKTLVPEFPDCFRVIGNGDIDNYANLLSGSGSDLCLELVCWSNELACSCMEKKAASDKIDYKKGMPLAFPMQFSKGFEMDKHLKKWLNDWQKLPYISPYENATHLGSSTDESDKWAVSVLHEVLNLFVWKKVEMDTLLCLGEWLGIRSRFKRALLHHPGLFYLSNKMGSCTVVLREAYKRGMLIERSPLIDIRNQYVHLMITASEDHKAISVSGGSKQREKKMGQESKEQGEKGDNVDAVVGNDMDLDHEDDDDDIYDESEEEGENMTHAGRNLSNYRSRLKTIKKFDARGPSKNFGRQRLVQKHHGVTKDVDDKDLDLEDDESEKEGESMTHGHRNLSNNRSRMKPIKIFDAREPSRNFGRQKSGRKSDMRRRPAWS
ncbi:protein WHAT'S THIS FACTOR 9, mitochondrial [Mercurialis annua]|uniref:protein WHAT'S THIS FACTOR 9, mitochondrial n=1 Tax=Mercurialis annua TaxID=3986 RepID=UPI00215FB61F|nr:protein WHAT'S THIS FACTOR 9, mitochondrial [Mercurialis annua]